MWGRAFSRLIPKRFLSHKIIANDPPLKPFNGRVQYISDIHLDRNPFQKYLVQPAYWRNRDPGLGEILVVAGDLGNPFSPAFESFFQYNCRFWDKLIFVPGNHEFYYDAKLANQCSDHRIGSYEGTQEKLREIESKFSNVRILMQDHLEVKLFNDEKLHILGSTLWSEIPVAHHQRFQKNFSDYFRISFQGKPITPEVTNQLHYHSVEWLEQKIKELENKSPKQRILVVTHHAPLIHGTCHPKFLGKCGIDRVKHYNYAFSSDLSHLFVPMIAAWIFGHTHYRVCFKHPSGTVLAQNHLGYTKSSDQSIRVL